MKLINIEKEETKVVKNFNNGSFTTELFATPDELERWRSNDRQVGMEMHGNSFSYPINVTHYEWTYNVEVSREYLEQKFPLKYILQLIKKLSSHSNGALSKQLYKYFSKAGTSQMKNDLLACYKPMEKVDLSDLDNRKWFTTNFVLHYQGKMVDFGHDMEFLQLDGITGKHLSRCLAILADKGYITSENQKHNRGFKRGGVYTYSNTYYTLTEKAEKYLETK